MKSYEIVGWAYCGAIYCAAHKPKSQCSYPSCRDSECCPQPVFVCAAQIGDICDECSEPLLED